MIGVQLTEAQKQRVNTLVQSLNTLKENLEEEVTFCLLNPKHFTACGNDFSRKLNAIRGVILRGDWQTPAGMVRDDSTTQKTNNLIIEQLKNELREVHAEANHFEKLLTTAKEHTRDHFESIISQAKKKASDIEARLSKVLNQQQEVSF